MADTYTEADVELVAQALHNHPGDLPFDYYDDAKRALDALAAAGRLREPRIVVTCDAHKPVQHRDGKPPWCRRCGYGDDGKPWRDLPSPLLSVPNPEERP